ncbi:PEP-CTERM sorting domain-containing protein [Microcystis aeruginosa]|uniref:PEP-CTERM sorting domain-containing protein n=1 Tax=Microcystis aeruginosa TaxID=1126 RepID=UPI001E6255EB|nr:PEP-CTERM sorting domain-containing protein [Microcystis aeruginosa]
MDSLGASLSDGASDPHYSIVSPSGAGIVINQANIPSSYVANTSTSRWIWQQADGQPANVTRTFRTTFDLTGLNPSTASIVGTWAADNFLDQILINGVSIGTIPNNLGGFNFTSFMGFNVNSGFQAGINTLDFVVRDIGMIAGFRIGEISGTAQPISLSQSVPEPSTILGLGLLGFGAFFNRQLSQGKKSKQED